MGAHENQSSKVTFLFTDSTEWDASYYRLRVACYHLLSNNDLNYVPLYPNGKDLPLLHQDSALVQSQFENFYVSFLHLMNH